MGPGFWYSGSDGEDSEDYSNSEDGDTNSEDLDSNSEDGNLEDWYDSEDWDTDLEDSSDDGDDNSEGDNGSSLQNTSDGPLKKKAKTSQSIAASPSEMENLSLLPTIPLDLLFEIFSLLHPKDILSASRTSRIFHEALSSRNMLGVWKAARKSLSIPDGPDWMREDVWANLLFGDKCQSCGSRRTQKVDFLLLKRICISCKKTHYVLRSKFEKQYPDFDFVILLVPSTNIPSRHDRSRLLSYCWDFDLESMVSKLAALKKDGDARQLNCFMGERRRRLLCLRQNSFTWQNYYEQMQRDAEERRLQQIKEKFKELGYVDEDLRTLCFRKECRGTVQLSGKIWSRIRPILEPDVKQRMAERLVEIKWSRRRVLAIRYKVFQRTLHPSHWKYLPRTLEIAAFKAFSRHLEANVEVEVDGSTFDDAFLELPNLLASAAERRRATLRILIGGREDGEIGADPIDLATAVFQCFESSNFSHFKYVFGWDEIGSHHCQPESLDRFKYRDTPITVPLLKYRPEVADVVKKLAQLIGLDAATATAADFDEKNKRFSCGACPCFLQQDQYFQNGYTWRNLAVHLQKWKAHNPSLDISVLSDNAEIEIKQCERDDHNKANQWTCTHCSEHLDNLQDRQSVIKHLSDSHGIQTPSEPTDYLFFERCRSNRATTRFSVPAPQKLDPEVNSNYSQKHFFGKFRCLACVSSMKKRDRQFILHGVVQHLKAVHSISIGQNGIHYVPV